MGSEVPISGQSFQDRDLQDDGPNLSKGAAMTFMAAEVEVMKSEVPKYVTRARASFLLGIPEQELSRISKESGLGHVERAGNEEKTYFTLDELLGICLLAGYQMQTVYS